MRDLRILHIVLGLDVGGLERFLQSLLTHMQGPIHPSVACLNNKGTLGRSFGDVPIYELRKPEGLSPRAVLDLIRIIRKNRIDVIHTHNPGPHFYGAIAGLTTGIPLVHTKHGRNFPTVRRKVLMNALASYFSRFIVPVSKDAEQVCLDVEHIRPAKIRLIRNGIEFEQFFHRETREVTREIFGIPDSTFLIGTVARLAKPKDHGTLIRACVLLLSEGVDFRLLVIGDGPLRKEMEILARDLGLGTHIVFTGMRYDVPDLLAELDLFVLSSVSEGLSISILEAMASRLPIVATDVGGNREVVVEGITGFLTPSGNPVQLAEKIMLLAQDRKLASAMGLSGYQRVKDQFCIRETADRYCILYQEASDTR